MAARVSHRRARSYELRAALAHEARAPHRQLQREQREQHPTELRRSIDARLALCSAAEPGLRWIAARRREDFLRRERDEAGLLLAAETELVAADHLGHRDLLSAGFA